jgi:S1-C subfamily serine protease
LRKELLIAANQDELPLVKGGPAEVAGLRAGDIILSVSTALSWVPSRTCRRLLVAMQLVKRLDLVYLRDNKESSVTATLGKK